jgi:hypothetical protein
MSIFTEFATLDSTGAGDGERVALRDLEGSVVVMVPLEYIPVVETANGPSDCVRVDIHDISGKRSYRDQLVFARVIVNGLKSKVTPEGVDDIQVLGVVGKGASKAGKSSPWILTSATEAQATAASEYMDAL